MRTYVRMVACVYLPRFELVAAAEGSSVARRAVAGGALAVAPPVSADGAVAAGGGGGGAGAGRTRRGVPGVRRAGGLEEGAEGNGWRAGRPVGRLGYGEEATELLDPLRRLGVDTLGELRKLGRAGLGDRFGPAGPLPHRLAAGEDSPLRPRHPQERLLETMEVGDAGSGDALKRVLGVLVSRLLARAERRGRTLRSVRLSARLGSGGSWHEEVVVREPVSDPQRIWLAASLRLALAPAPADP